MARQSFINHSNLTQILETGRDVSVRFGGVSVEAAFLRNNAVPSDTDLSVSHDTINIVRVNFVASDRYNALELTVTARSVYVAFGDHVDERIKALFSGCAVERKSSWVMKNKVAFSSITEMCAVFSVADEVVYPMMGYSELWEACNRDYIIPTPKVTKRRVHRKRKEAA